MCKCVVKFITKVHISNVFVKYLKHKKTPVNTGVLSVFSTFIAYLKITRCFCPVLSINVIVKPCPLSKDLKASSASRIS